MVPTHSQKDGVESNGGSLKGGAEAFMLFLCGAQLILRLSVLRVFDLEVNVTLKNAEIYGSVLSGEGGSANGWPCCWGAPGLPQLPPATPKNPPPFIASLLHFCFRGDVSNQYSFRTAGGKPVFSFWESGWNEQLWYNPVFSCIGNLKTLRSHVVRCYLDPCRQSRILGSLSCWWIWRSYCMPSCVFQWS